MAATRDTEAILDILKQMGEVELAISRMYRICGDAWDADKALWSGLEAAEIKHANTIEEMAGMIRRTPDRFQLNRPFNIAAIKTVRAGIEHNIDRLNKKLISRESMLILARDIESSLLEKSYHDIVKTDDLAFQTLIKRVVTDTSNHKNTIADKIIASTAQPS